MQWVQLLCSVAGDAGNYLCTWEDPSCRSTHVSKTSTTPCKPVKLSEPNECLIVNVALPACVLPCTKSNAGGEKD